MFEIFVAAVFPTPRIFSYWGLTSLAAFFHESLVSLGLFQTTCETQNRIRRIKRFLAVLCNQKRCAPRDYLTKEIQRKFTCGTIQETMLRGVPSLRRYGQKLQERSHFGTKAIDYSIPPNSWSNDTVANFVAVSLVAKGMTSSPPCSSAPQV